jgi:hypothetical protein
VSDCVSVLPFLSFFLVREEVSKIDLPIIYQCNLAIAKARVSFFLCFPKLLL